jgi:hypothetical protein
MITIFDKRPPFVRFEERELGIDPAASEKEGRPIPRVVVMACITPHGSKDVVEKVAEDWLKQIRAQALQGNYNLDWVKFFEESYAEWKKGNELPREGTPIATWPMAHNEARKRIRAAGYQTVEDLAQIPDSGITEIGLDGRYWRDTARAWVNESQTKGANAKELADVKAENERLRGELDRQRERHAALERRLEALEDEKREAPRRRRESHAEA